MAQHDIDIAPATLRADDWCSLETLTGKVGGTTTVFRTAAGVRLKVRYGFGWFGFDRQSTTTIGTNFRRLLVPGPDGDARMQARVSTDDGQGQLSRRDGNRDPFVDELRPGVCIDIGIGITFQFRARGDRPLTMLLLTMPSWPGADEALPTPSSATWPLQSAASSDRGGG